MGELLEFSRERLAEKEKARAEAKRTEKKERARANILLAAKKLKW